MVSRAQLGAEGGLLQAATVRDSLLDIAITFSDKIELPKGVELQSTADIACRVLSYYPGLCSINLSLYF